MKRKSAMHFMFIALIFFAEVSLSSNHDITFSKIHNCLEFVLDTQELIKREDLIEHNIEDLKIIQQAMINNPAGELEKIFAINSKLSKERKYYFWQMNKGQDTAEALGYDYEWILKTKSFHLLRGRDEEMFQIACKALSDNAFARYSSHPLSFLEECVLGSSGYICSLSRLHYPMYRNFFEDILVENLIIKAQETNGQLNFLELGSGDLFQTLVVLEKFLNKANNHNLNIIQINLHLIDPKYESEIQKGMRTLKEEEEQYKKWWGNITCSTRHWLTFYQLINWLKLLHKSINFHVHIYSSLDQYININQNSSKLDALWATDLQLGSSKFESQGLGTFVLAPFDDILKDEAFAFCLLDIDGSVIQVSPKNYISKVENIELTLEKIGDVKFDDQEMSERLRNKSERKCIKLTTGNK